MIEGLYISASGMLPKATKQEAIANNLANARVPGFKRDSLFMREVMEARKRLSGDYPEWRMNRVEGVWTDHSQGHLRQTSSAYDMALNGQGFFAVRTPEGVQYTRNGHFARDNQGLLVTPLGYPVLDRGGNEIAIPTHFQEPIIEANGTIKGRDEQGTEQVIAQLQVVDFPALYDSEAMAASPQDKPLQKVGEGYLVPRPATTVQQAQDFSVVQGHLEEANVEAVREMVEMIETFRAFEASQRVIQVQDTTLDRAVNDVGAVR